MSLYTLDRLLLETFLHINLPLPYKPMCEWQALQYTWTHEMHLISSRLCGSVILHLTIIPDPSFSLSRGWTSTQPALSGLPLPHLWKRNHWHNLKENSNVLLRFLVVWCWDKSSKEADIRWETLPRVRKGTESRVKRPWYESKFSLSVTIGPR